MTKNMALTPGTKLGPYEIVAVLVAGGMGGSSLNIRLLCAGKEKDIRVPDEAAGVVVCCGRVN